MSECPCMPGMPFELAYELLLSHWLNKRDAVALASTSKTVATQMMQSCVWFRKGKLRYRIRVPWVIRINLWLRTATCEPHDQVLRRGLFHTLNGAAMLKTRTCRACGCHTQRKVHGVTLCEGCTREPRKRSFMISRVACQLVLVHMGYTAREVLPWMARVRWAHTRDGTMAFVTDVCRVTSVSGRRFLLCHRRIGSPR